MDNKPTISDKILERIEVVTPHSRTYFTLRNVGMWALAVCSVIVGALAVASIIFRAVNAGAVLGPGMPRIGPIARLIPVLWLVLVAGFGYLAYREVRATKRGYKYELSTLVLAMLLASAMLGIVFYVLGAGFRLDRLAGQYVPFHTSLERIQQERWLEPENGFLVGVVVGETERGVTLVDPARVEWSVEFAPSVVPRQIEALNEGERVGMRGALLDSTEHKFLACEVRSLEFAGRGMQKAPPHRLFKMDERKFGPARITECEDVRPRD